MWSIGSILTALLSFMNEDEPTTGGMIDSPENRSTYARESKAFNQTDKLFREMFGDTAQIERKFDDIDRLISSKAAISAKPTSSAAACSAESSFSASSDAILRSTNASSCTSLSSPPLHSFDTTAASSTSPTSTESSSTDLSLMSIQELKTSTAELGLEATTQGLSEKLESIDLLLRQSPGSEVDGTAEEDNTLS